MSEKPEVRSQKAEELGGRGGLSPRVRLVLSGVLAAGLGVAVGLGGCGVSQPFPEKNLYAIDAGVAASAPASAPATMTIRLAPVRIAKPFDGQTFVYRVGPEQYKVDYYNGFVAPPDRLISAQLAGWLAGSGVVKYAVAGGSSLDCGYTLETNVTGLYCDYTQAKSPRAVVEVTCFLIEDAGGGPRLVLQKRYRQEAAVGADKPGELAAGFGRAWREIFGRLVEDLGKVR